MKFVQPYGKMFDKTHLEHKNVVKRFYSHNKIQENNAQFQQHMGFCMISETYWKGYLAES